MKVAVVVLQWDQEVFLPEGAIASCSEQVEALSKLLHEKNCASKFEKVFAEHVSFSYGTVLDLAVYDVAGKCLLYWVYRNWKRAMALLSDFVFEYSDLKCQTQH